MAKAKASLESGRAKEVRVNLSVKPSANFASVGVDVGLTVEFEPNSPVEPSKALESVYETCMTFLENKGGDSGGRLWKVCDRLKSFAPPK